MKKLLILLSLTTAMTAFGAANVIEESDTMKITAKIVKPLRVSSEAMALGTIVQGASASGQSTVTIEGDRGHGITVDLIKPTHLTSTNGDQLQIVLNTNYIPTHIGEDEKTEFIVYGNISAESTATAPSGVYSGNLITSVRYN
ncbi:hypothetical protein [Cetobacterium sp. 2G large]|uniref:hypothetical protein n=1 Tax=Cetobacterium sp. 2G large TaxID=2759680 RepID=UPI00163D18F5|nr:hypothetical protein [Cetobacterium sp. 2G large]MBC2854088.1 hypothetical protein [Cetobacterium sp. 2G large]